MGVPKVRGNGRMIAKSEDAVPRRAGCRQTTLRSVTAAAAARALTLLQALALLHLAWLLGDAYRQHCRCLLLALLPFTYTVHSSTPLLVLPMDLGALSEDQPDRVRQCAAARV